jgi:hypothetical protein
MTAAKIGKLFTAMQMALWQYLLLGSIPYRYSLNNGPSQNGSMFTGLPAGTYVITVTDSMHGYYYNNWLDLFLAMMQLKQSICNCYWIWRNTTLFIFNR